MKRSKIRSLVSIATVLNAVAVLVVTVLILGIGERWWLSAALCYLPRLPWLAPSIALTFACLVIRPKWTPWAALPALLIAVPLMGLCYPVAAATPLEHTMRIASCNIQDGNPRFASVVREFQRVEPDVLVLQECDEPHPLMNETYPDWYHAHAYSFSVTSRWPVEHIGLVESDGSNRYCAGLFRVAHPDKPFLLVDVHLSTARHGLSHLRDRSLSFSEAIDLASRWQDLRETEIHELATRTREFTDEPVLLVGDFNQPWSGQFVQDAFGSTFTNAFDVAGTGYGFTAPTDSGRLWPHNSPWLRIDHIAVDDSYGVTHAEIGRSAGSDHRLITADVTW